MPSTFVSPVAQFSGILRDQGVLEGLIFLNKRVKHRCTAIYRLDGLMMRSLFLFDREGALLPDALGAVPLEDSFCQHAIREGVLLTDDSNMDSRLDGSAYQGVVVAYHALPLLDDKGGLFGTLCHFDFVPRGLPDSEFETLQKTARVLPSYL